MSVAVQYVGWWIPRAASEDWRIAWSFLLPSSPLLCFHSTFGSCPHLLSPWRCLSPDTSVHLPNLLSSSLWSLQHFLVHLRYPSSSDTCPSAVTGEGANAAIQPAHVGAAENSAAAGESPAPQNPAERREDAHGHVQEEPSHPLQWECIRAAGEDKTGQVLQRAPGLRLGSGVSSFAGLMAEGRSKKRQLFPNF